MNPKIQNLLDQRKQYQQIVERAAISMYGEEADIYERTEASVAIYSIDQEIERVLEDERMRKRGVT
jgi:hypothetical protein